MMDPVWRFIDMVAAHPFASAVIAFAIFFAASLCALITIEYARRIWRMPMIRLPPPEDRVQPETQDGNNPMDNVVLGIVLFIIMASALVAIWAQSGQLR
jgi:hypothetical protein